MKELSILLDILETVNQAKGRLDYTESYYPHDENLLDVRKMLEQTSQKARDKIEQLVPNNTSN